MKNSIARKITRRISIILFVCFTVFIACSFGIAYRVIISKTNTYCQAITGVFADIIVNDSEKYDVPVNEENASIVLKYAEYICTWYKIDYAYVFKPDIENGTITYVAAYKSDKINGPEIENDYIGKTKQYTLRPEELAVYNGENMFCHFYESNEFGREISTCTVICDPFGNRLIAGIDKSWNEIYSQVVFYFLIIAAISAAVILLIYFSVYYLLKKNITAPAQSLSRKMQDFITNGTLNNEKLSVKGNNEFSMMSDSFNSMAADIESYLDDIKSLTGEKERRNAELDIASRIQQGFLSPGKFETSNYSLDAIMSPAKDVGGDLYDYIPLDDNRVMLVVADVSGKGVAASIYMVVILTLFRQYAKMGLSPAEILEKTNDTLAAKNKELLFATAFVAIYNAETNLLTYSNAGHNPPYIAGRELKTLSKANGTLLGLFPGEKYSCAEEYIGFGETLFMFTDGVTESINPANEFFGEKRLEDALVRFKNGKAENAVDYIIDVINDFSNGTEKHDDITILSLTMKQSEEFILKPEISELEKIKEKVLKLPFGKKTRLELFLAAEECFVNICSYAYEEKKGKTVRFTLTLSDKLEISFEDSGIPFDPLTGINSPDETDEDKIGGLGRFIAFSSVDDAMYERTDGKNILKLIKYPEEDEK